MRTANRVMAVAAVLSLGGGIAPLMAEPRQDNFLVAQATDARPDSGPRMHRRPSRLTVYPTGRFYRLCTDWYEIQHRPAGDVIYPQMSCRWVAR